MLLKWYFSFIYNITRAFPFYPHILFVIEIGSDRIGKSIIFIFFVPVLIFTSFGNRPRIIAIVWKCNKFHVHIYIQCEQTVAEEGEVECEKIKSNKIHCRAHFVYFNAYPTFFALRMYIVRCVMCVCSMFYAVHGTFYLNLHEFSLSLFELDSWNIKMVTVSHIANNKLIFMVRLKFENK